MASAIGRIPLVFVCTLLLFGGGLLRFNLLSFLYFTAATLLWNPFVGRFRARGVGVTIWALVLVVSVFGCFGHIVYLLVHRHNENVLKGKETIQDFLNTIGFRGTTDSAYENFRLFGTDAVVFVVSVAGLLATTAPYVLSVPMVRISERQARLATWFLLGATAFTYPSVVNSVYFVAVLVGVGGWFFIGTLSTIMWGALSIYSSFHLVATIMVQLMPRHLLLKPKAMEFIGIIHIEESQLRDDVVVDQWTDFVTSFCFFLAVGIYHRILHGNLFVEKGKNIRYESAEEEGSVGDSGGPQETDPLLGDVPSGDEGRDRVTAPEPEGKAAEHSLEDTIEAVFTRYGGGICVGMMALWCLGSHTVIALILVLLMMVALCLPSSGFLGGFGRTLGSFNICLGCLYIIGLYVVNIAAMPQLSPLAGDIGMTRFKYRPAWLVILWATLLLMAAWHRRSRDSSQKVSLDRVEPLLTFCARTVAKFCYLCSLVALYLAGTHRVDALNSVYIFFLVILSLFIGAMRRTAVWFAVLGYSVLVQVALFMYQFSWVEIGFADADTLDWLGLRKWGRGMPGNLELGWHFAVAAMAVVSITYIDTAHNVDQAPFADCEYGPRDPRKLSRRIAMLGARTTSLLERQATEYSLLCAYVLLFLVVLTSTPSLLVFVHMVFLYVFLTIHLYCGNSARRALALPWLCFVAYSAGGILMHYLYQFRQVKKNIKGDPHLGLDLIAHRNIAVDLLAECAMLLVASIHLRTVKTHGSVAAGLRGWLPWPYSSADLSPDNLPPRWVRRVCNLMQFLMSRHAEKLTIIGMFLTVIAHPDTIGVIYIAIIVCWIPFPRGIDTVWLPAFHTAQILLACEFVFQLQPPGTEGWVGFKVYKHFGVAVLGHVFLMLSCLIQKQSYSWKGLCFPEDAAGLATDETGVAEASEGKGADMEEGQKPLAIRRRDSMIVLALESADWLSSFYYMFGLRVCYCAILVGALLMLNFVSLVFYGLLGVIMFLTRHELAILWPFVLFVLGIGLLYVTVTAAFYKDLVYEDVQHLTGELSLWLLGGMDSRRIGMIGGFLAFFSASLQSRVLWQAADGGRDPLFKPRLDDPADDFTREPRSVINDMRFFACRSMWELVLFFVFIVGASSSNVLRLGYVVLAMMYLLLGDTLVRRRRKAYWNLLRLYNYFVIGVVLAFQYPQFSESQVSYGWSQNIGVTKLTPKSILSGISGSLLPDLIIFVMLNMQMEIFEAPGFKFFENHLKEEEENSHRRGINVHKRLEMDIKMSIAGEAKAKKEREGMYHKIRLVSGDAESMFALYKDKVSAPPNKGTPSHSPAPPPDAPGSEDVANSQSGSVAETASIAPAVSGSLARKLSRKKMSASESKLETAPASGMSDSWFAMTYLTVHSYLKSLGEDFRPARSVALTAKDVPPRFIDAVASIARVGYLAVLNNTALLVYVMLIANGLFSGSVVSFVYLGVLFLYALLEYPNPPKRFWQALLIYTLTIIVAKFIFQLPIFCFDELRNRYDIEPHCSAAVSSDKYSSTIPVASLQEIIGIAKYNTTGFLEGVILDVLVLLVVLIHRRMLIKKGMWYVPSKFRKAVQPKPDEGGGDQVTVKSPLPSPLPKYHSSRVSTEDAYVDQLYVMPAESFLWYFRRLLDVHHKPGANFYIVTLVLQLVILLYIFFFYSYCTSSVTDLAESIHSNQFSGETVLMILLQLFVMVFERVVYLRRALRAKLIFYYAVVVVVHVGLLYLLPMRSQEPFTANKFVQMFYLLECLYLVVSGLQIKYGYQRPSDMKFMSDDHRNYAVFAVYKASPFVLELKSLLDWVVVPTALRFTDWLKLDDIYGTLYVAYSDRMSQEKRLLGQVRSLWTKFRIGVVLFFILLLVVLAPLLIFSTLNPATVANPVRNTSVTLRIKGPSGFWILYESNLFQSMKQLAEEEEEVRSLKVYMRKHGMDPKILRAEHLSALQKITLFPESDKFWDLSPPARQGLLNMLEKSSASDVRFSLEVEFEREGPPNGRKVQADLTTLVDRPGSQLDEATIGTLRRTIEGTIPANTRLELAKLYPQFIHLPRTGAPKVLEKTASLQYAASVDLQLTGAAAGAYPTQSQWWAITMDSHLDKSNGTSNATAANSTTSHNLMLQEVEMTEVGKEREGGMIIYVVSDDIAYGPLSSLLAVGLVGLYITFVFSIGRFLRMFVNGISRRMTFEDLPDTSLLIEMCKDIYRSRIDGQHDIEERLYYHLVDVYRSPERIMELTGTWIKPKQD